MLWAEFPSPPLDEGQGEEASLLKLLGRYALQFTNPSPLISLYRGRGEGSGSHVVFSNNMRILLAPAGFRFVVGSPVELCEHDPMGMMKNYLLKILEQCSEEQFGQDAIEWAIVTGRVRLTYDLERDVRESMSRYDEIIEAYRRSLARAKEELPKKHAPMQRAVPRRRVKAVGSTSAAKEKHAA